MNELKTLAIIPARGGSKRFPNKNIHNFNGVPLITHSINYAKANKIENIIVSTDNDEIEKIAIQYGVKVSKRPMELATDYSPTIDTLKYTLKEINKSFDFVILLQPTNPLRPKSLLNDALKIITEKKGDSLMTVTRSYQKFGKIRNQKFVPFNYKLGQRSQDLEPLYYENGLIYISTPNLILSNKIIGENHIPLIVDHPYAKVDIDTKEDLAFAQYILNQHLD
ncbi:MAG: acylneuraminate cytidylyltransferase family protein [Lutibacter sp.]